MSCRVYRDEHGPGVPRATKEHMPFVGHRNCAQWGKRPTPGDYGLDPGSLKVREG